MIHALKPHPFGKHPDDTDVHAVSKLVDPLHGVVGTPSRLGSYIQMKVMPNILNICIKKGVQKKALYLLAKQLLEQNRTNFTHVLIKRKKSGRYLFKTLYSRHVTTSGPMWAKYKRYGRKQLKSIYTILHGNQIESKASHKDFTRQNCWGDLVKS